MTAETTRTIAGILAQRLGVEPNVIVFHRRFYIRSRGRVYRAGRCQGGGEHDVVGRLHSFGVDQRGFRQLLGRVVYGGGDGDCSGEHKLVDFLDSFRLN
jgi:hypothetical protein